MSRRKRIEQRDRTLITSSVVGAAVMVGSLVATTVLAAEIQQQAVEQQQEAKQKAFQPAKTKPSITKRKKISVPPAGTSTGS